MSNPELVGRRLRDLDLGRHRGAVVPRFRHGDVESAPNGDTVLALDRTGPIVWDPP